MYAAYTHKFPRDKERIGEINTLCIKCAYYKRYTMSIHHTHTHRETRYKSLKRTTQDGGRGKFSLFSLV